MRWGRRHGSGRGAHRLIWQSASLLLAYPDEAQPERLDTVEALCERLGDEPADPLRATLGYLRRTPLSEAAQHYVSTFDLQRRTTLLLTYWTDGDTRNRGAAMLAFARSYRAAGVAPPRGEAPDHLAVVLEFAATVDPRTGGALLAAHRPAIDAVHTALAERHSPYAGVLAAVAATLPVATEQDVHRTRELVTAGPPAEQVGLQPFTLTVPPRRTEPERGGG
ncbi:nitrate reductase molybdenum cofactor assembly chaperone [Nocardia cyriacigeorgica]|uniref:nitrate reductase molybdenum cofactor assembly chaperone n=1 Tax=Nocardia cyriacigeorgica TaxID=135487 RepID=UPI0003034B84|nr:nitrate reductase molybdenum cofactor assembly chaperone [Nocardia cyriacigeorgica]MBF6498109.1 nitrate reductase molybdenum cofactor assembly chaperone [Nocardia cyriacigeorgica]TLF60225.1 nitrate reductase molybdenum cofactor assembly chaperone [Nocardia cyriacigeorgica]